MTGEGIALGPDTRVSVASTVHARSTGEEVVLLHFGRGAYYALGDVGSAVWARLGAGESLGAIADSIAREHTVDRAQALRDVIDLVRDLVREGLVTTA